MPWRHGRAGGRASVVIGIRGWERQTCFASRQSSLDGVSIFTALQEQGGLKLESAREVVGVLIIDSAEMPTPH
jgi:uncharacterized protein (TIGR03435 family)